MKYKIISTGTSRFPFSSGVNEVLTGLEELVNEAKKRYKNVKEVGSPQIVQCTEFEAYRAFQAITYDE